MNFFPDELTPLAQRKIVALRTESGELRQRADHLPDNAASTSLATALQRRASQLELAAYVFEQQYLVRIDELAAA